MSRRQRLPFIETKPKKVYLVESWRDPIGITKDSSEFAALNSGIAAEIEEKTQKIRNLLKPGDRD